MARRSGTAALEDQALPGLDGLDQDPAPAAARPRRGRPPGSRSKSTITKSTPRSAAGRVLSKTQMKAKVATELYGFASMFAGIWGMRDPCAAVLAEVVPTPEGDRERLEAIVMRTVDILARNDSVLGALAKSGLIGEIGMLGSLLYPVGKQIWQAHGPNGTGHRSVEELQDEYVDRYPAPSLA